MKNRRLTKKIGEYYCSQRGSFLDLYNKLGAIEDIMEKHNIPSVEYLNTCVEAHDKYGELTEQLGYSLEVLFKALKQCEFDGLFFDIETTDEEHLVGYIKCRLGYDPLRDKFFWNSGWFNAETWLDCYKKTWWLKKDKSE